MSGWFSIVQKYVFLARIQDQSPKHVYQFPPIISERLSRKNGRLLLRHLIHLNKPDLLDEYYAALADARFLAREIEKPKRVIDAARWKMWKRRMPLDYVLGWTPFGGMRIKIKPPVLIPRRETEFWMERLLQEIPENSSVRVMEAGTGSGCISIMLSKRRPAIRLTAIDIAPYALKLAKENATTNGVEGHMEFRRANIFDEQSLHKDSYDLIISNPPYVPPSSRPTTMAPSVRKWESSMATVGVGYADGTNFHRRVIQLGSALRSHRDQPRVAIELDGTVQQLHAVVSHAGHFGFTKTRVISDQNDHPRALFLY